MASLWSPNMASQDKSLANVVFDDPERSDPTVNFDALPENHPIHLLSVAREYYKYGRTPPPFTLNKRSEMEKLVVIPTKNGSRPKDEKAVKVKIVAKVCTLTSAFFCSLRCPRPMSSSGFQSRCLGNISFESSMLIYGFTTSYGTKTPCSGLLT